MELKRNNTLALLILVFFGIIYTIQVVINHYYFRTYALDYGFYNQAFWDFAHFRMNKNTVFEPDLINYFQVHPAFTLPIISPLYWIFNPIFGTYSLLIIQNIFILLGGAGTYLYIKRKTENNLLAILALIHFNVVWGHYSALAADYIDTTLAASIVPLFLYFFDKRKIVWAAICFLFIILTKENMPIWFIFICITLILMYKEMYFKKLALIFLISSIAYLIIAFKLIIPYFENPEFPYWGFAYSALGENISEAFKFIFLHPLKTVKLLFVNHTDNSFFDKVKFEFYYVFLISGGIFLFLKPKYLIVFIPVIAQKMFNDSFSRWGIDGFYSIEVVSVLSVFLFMSLQIFKKPKVQIILGIVITVLTLSITMVKMNSREISWFDKSKEKIYDPKFYEPPFDVKKVSLNLEIIPKNAKVTAMSSVLPHLSQRNYIQLFPDVKDSEYIVFLIGTNPYPLNSIQFNEQKEKYLNDNNWQVLIDDSPLLILKRKV